MGRSKPPVDPRNDAFEKFFLKASKSVPRIGRRQPPPLTYYNDDLGKYPDSNPKRVGPLWADISEKFEFEPEVFSNPELLEEYETALADDPLAYDIPSRMRYKRENTPSQIEDKRIMYQVLVMKDSLMVFINNKSEMSLKDMSIAMIGQHCKDPISSKLFGDFMDESSQALATKLSKKLQKPVYVSYNVENDRLTSVLVERQLFKEIKDNPDKF
ncbi:proteasome assembly chaperone 4 [Holotrichia oblita]|uniref:Proteasome assembly chaperone 4 n=1 Tax=Holotrichia oblita TaxID=644536 RepID=A0ACB9TJV8_HOLOL|nr:proteasome assembly chaperone 4 [Holotrichia oblita]